MKVKEFYEFKSMEAGEKIASLACLERWDDVEPEYYECLCEEVGLNYHSYDDPEVMWADILRKAGDQVTPEKRRAVFCEAWCEELGLDFSKYENSNTMWTDIFMDSRKIDSERI